MNQEVEENQPRATWPYGEHFFQQITDYILEQTPDIEKDRVQIVIHQAPEVVLFVPVTDDFLQTNWPSDTRISAYYDPDELVIYFNQDMNQETDYFKSMILHEFFHHIQYQLNKQDFVACEQELERGAYGIQADYLESLGYDSDDDFYAFVRFSSILAGRCSRDF